MQDSHRAYMKFFEVHSMQQERFSLETFTNQDVSKFVRQASPNTTVDYSLWFAMHLHCNGYDKPQTSKFRCNSIINLVSCAL